MIRQAFDSDLAPSDVYSWEHPGTAWFIDNGLYGFLSQVDRARVSLYLNVNTFQRLPKCTTPLAIYSMFGEVPRWGTLDNFCVDNPDVKILLLTDMDFYDYPLSSQITHVSYRHWIWYLDWFNNAQSVRPVLAKNKKIKWKFSSLSFKATQFRALVTAYLLSQARDQSIVSWHAVSDSEADQWVQTMKDHPKFQDIDWSILDQQWLIDQFSWSKSTPIDNMADLTHAAFSQSLVNINNETTNFGWRYVDAGQGFNRPGPYLTEKTWKSLLSGCVLLNSGQPGLYKYLETHYNIQCAWKVSKDYDSEMRDFDRALALLATLQDLRDRDLVDLIDGNIDCCQDIQNLLLDPDYLDKIYNYNRTQDDKILQACSEV